MHMCMYSLSFRRHVQTGGQGGVIAADGQNLPRAPGIRPGCREMRKDGNDEEKRIGN